MSNLINFDILQEQQHTCDGENQYNCKHNDCRREFKTRRNLIDHTRGHHQEKKPHACSHPGCGKSFLRPAHLLIHSRIHTGEKPFVCDYLGCGKRWNQKSALKQHVRSHTGERPFVCNVAACNKRFSTSSSCKRHVNTHHPNYDERLEHSKNFLSHSLEEYDSQWTFSTVHSPCPSGSPYSSSSDVEYEMSFATKSNKITAATINNHYVKPKMAVNYLLN